MKTNVQKHMEMLGNKVVDKVTGFAGVCSSVSFDLYGCVQVVITPPATEGGTKYGECRWFDIGRVEVTATARVMDLPDYDFGKVAEGRKGPAEKPAF